MKKHNLLKVIGITILITLLLTWIFPVTYYSYGLVEDVRQRAGIFDVLSYATVTVSYFGNICLYILAIGGFYGVIHKIDAYRSLLERIVKGFKGKEYIFMSIVMILFAVIVSMTGLSIGILFLFPFVISIILLMGYDKITAAMVTVGSTLVGLIGSTYSYANTSQLSQLLSVKPETEIIAKIIILVLGLALLIFNVLRYAKNHRDTKKISKDISYIPVESYNNGINIKILLFPLVIILLYVSLFLLHWIIGLIITALVVASIVSIIVIKNKKINKKINDKKASKKSSNILNAKDKNVKIWPLVLIVDLMILVMILSFISWETTFNLKFFNDITTKFLEFKTAKSSIMGVAFGKSVTDFTVFGSIFGKVSAFGAWDLTHLLINTVIASGIIALVYRVKFNDYLDSFVMGARRAIKPAVLVALIYIVLVITTYHPFLLTILKPILTLTSGLNVFTMSIAAFISSIFNVEMMYAVSSTLQYGMTLVKPETYPLVAVIWQAMYGLAMLVAPTSVILFVTLSFMHVNYLDWLKAIWKLFVELLILLLIIFTIMILI